MTDSKLDYPSSRQHAQDEAQQVFSGNAKLDLPGTGAEFARQEGFPANYALSARQFRFRNARQIIADAAGQAIVNLGRPSQGYYWLVERIAVKGAGTATVYVGEIEDYTIADFTPTASQDIADESSPIYVAPGEEIIVVFTGAGVGTLCTVSMQVNAIPTG